LVGPFQAAPKNELMGKSHFGPPSVGPKSQAKSASTSAA